MPQWDQSCPRSCQGTRYRPPWPLPLPCASRTPSYTVTYSSLSSIRASNVSCSPSLARLSPCLSSYSCASSPSSSVNRWPIPWSPLTPSPWPLWRPCLSSPPNQPGVRSTLAIASQAGCAPLPPVSDGMSRRGSPRRHRKSPHPHLAPQWTSSRGHGRCPGRPRRGRSGRGLLGIFTDSLSVDASCKGLSVCRQCCALLSIPGLRCQNLRLGERYQKKIGCLQLMAKRMYLRFRKCFLCQRF